MNFKNTSSPRLATILALCVATAFAEWQPGLRYGVLDRTSNTDFKTDEFPAAWTVVSYPEGADTKSAWPMAKGKTGIMVYSGQIYLKAGVYWFVESADDSTRLAIGGTQVLSDSSWSNPALARWTVQSDGWYDFDLRFIDGGGGYGPTKYGWWTRDSLAFAWKIGDEEAGSAVADNKVPEKFSLPKNADGATLENCLFRYDDGLGFADELVIAQTPFPIPVAYTPSTIQSGLANGSTVACSSTAAYETNDGAMKATLTGYAVSNIVNNVFSLREERTDGTSSFTYTHNGFPNTLYWNWAIQYKLTLLAEDGGSVDTATGWRDMGETVTITASHDSKPFVNWSGDVDASLATVNPVTVTMDQARTLTAHFGSAELYADATNGDDTTGTGSADAPFKTFTRVMQVAAGGFTVYLAPGTYNVTAETVVNASVTIIGLGDDPSEVVIKGPQKNNVRVITLNNADARLENLTVSHGHVYGSGTSSRKDGANVYIGPAGGTVTNCILSNAKQQYHTCGGGVYVDSPDGLVTHCIIRDNFMIDGNGTGGVGVGMSAGRVEYCLIAGNHDLVSISPNKQALCAVSISGGVMEHCTIVDNVHAGSVVTLTGGEMKACVIARNHNLYYPQASQVNATAALLGSAFTNCVWDLGDISASCPSGTVAFADYAARDYRLASKSAGCIRGEYDWGCFETDETSELEAAEYPASVTITPDDNITEALRGVRAGGELILSPGTYKISENTVILRDAITVRGADGCRETVIVKKDGSLSASLFALSHADATLRNMTLADYNTTSGPNQCALGVTLVQDGGTLADCVVRNMSNVTSSHAGTAVRIRRSGGHVTRCVISNIVTHANTGFGGAVAVEAADSLVDNCLICDCNNDTWNSPTSNHWSKDTPGAIYQTAGTIANCTIVNCKAPITAVAKCTGGVICDTIIYGNVRYNTSVAESAAIGTGAGLASWENVVSDLIAVNDACFLADESTIGFVDDENGDFHITNKSIARNVCGRTPFEGSSATDLDGKARLFGSRVDAGCYECHQSDAMMFIVR